MPKKLEEELPSQQSMVMMIHCLGEESLVAHLVLLPAIAILAGSLHFGRGCQECPKPDFLYQEAKGLALHIPQHIRSAEKHTSVLLCFLWPF